MLLSSLNKIIILKFIALLKICANLQEQTLNPFFQSLEDGAGRLAGALLGAPYRSSSA